MNKKIGLIALSIFFAFFVIFSLFPNFLLTLELKIFDGYTVLVKNAGYFLPNLIHSVHLDDIIIITVDEQTIQKLKKKVPLPRYFFADMLNRIYSVNPKMVVFDIVFTGESENKEDDERLSMAMEGKNNILLPYSNDEAGRPLVTDDLFLKGFPPAGFINKPTDIDATVRRIRPFDLNLRNNIIDGCTEFHIFNKYYNYDLKNISREKRRFYLNNLKPNKEDGFGKFNFSLLKDGTMWIKYQADRADIKKIPLWQVLADGFDPSVFNNKIILVGVTAKILHDIHNTPFKLIPGVEIMANVAAMFLDGKFIVEAPTWLKWLLIFILCMLTVFLCYRLPMLKGFLFIVSLVSIVVATTIWLFIKYYYLNPFKLVLAVVISYIAINFYKYSSVVMENLNLRKISTTDELTGLHTFRFFQVVLDHEFHKSLRYKTPLSLFMIDIDNFKKINDTYGHQNGNVVLKKIGKIILNNARKSDFPVRYGGEELAVLLPHTDTEGACKCAETIRRLIEKEDFFMTKEGPKKVTVSMGISSFPTMNITSSEEMVKFADSALYKAKHEGKNRVIIYTPEAEKSINAG